MNQTTTTAAHAGRVRNLLPERWQHKFDEDMSSDGDWDVAAKLTQWETVAHKLRTLDEESGDLDRTHELLAQRNEILQKSPDAARALQLHLEAMTGAA